MPAVTFLPFVFASLPLSFLLSAPAQAASEADAAPAAPLPVVVAQPSSGGEVNFAELKSLAAARAADDFYLKSSGISPDALDAASRKELAALTLAVAQAPETDRVIAFELAERALRLEESLPALLLSADLAAVLGESSAAAAHLDRAQALAPQDESVTLRRAALALHLRDWDTAEKLYGSIPASSPLSDQAKAGLENVKQSRQASDAEAVERAHRDLLRRMAAADAMIDSMPVSRFDLCRAHTLAACEAVAACKKTEVNCAFLLDSCPMSDEPVALERPRLGDCAAALSAVPCEDKEKAVSRLSAGVCNGLELRTSRNLLPEESTPAPKSDQDKKSAPSLDGVGVSPQDVDRVIRQLGGGR